jgi:hypothetical protein
MIQCARRSRGTAAGTMHGSRRHPEGGCGMAKKKRKRRARAKSKANHGKRPNT